MTTEIIKAKYSHDVFVPEKKPIVQEGQIVELKITSDVSVVQNFYGCLVNFLKRRFGNYFQCVVQWHDPFSIFFF